MIGDNGTGTYLRSAGQGRTNRNADDIVPSEEKLMSQLEEKAEWIAYLDLTIAACETALDERTRKVAELEQALERVSTSRTWKLANRLAQVSRRLLPAGSRRRHLIRSSYRLARGMYRLRSREYRASKLAAFRWAASRMIAPPTEPCADWFERTRSIRFPSFEKVAISIIIHVYNQMSETLDCLESIKRTTIGTRYEVIAVDDASSDRSLEQLGTIEGLVYLRNETKLGLIGSRSQGAAVARGEYLVFLSNDTVVTEGWLDAQHTDLAFNIRHAGHKVIYQPMARIVDRRGLTPGRSLESGTSSHEVASQEMFRRRWQDRPEAFHAGLPRKDGQNSHVRSEDLVDRGHVLVIDAHVLMPDQDCGSLRMMEVIRAMRRRGHNVSFFPDHPGPLGRYLLDLQSIGVEVILPPQYASLLEFLKHRGRQLDLAIISRAHIAANHMTFVRRLAPHAKVVFDTVDLHFLRAERQAQVTQDEALMSDLADRKRREIRLVHRADCTLVVSPIEKGILEKECPDCDVRVLPTIYPLDERDAPGFEDRREIIFIGNFGHTPNKDAVLHFIQEIFPRIHERLPQATFNVIGPNPAPEIVECAGPSIRILGHVPDVEPIFDRARVSVAPIRFGAGVKGKVNQSMALGVPVVASSIAAEGMYLVHERDAMIADDPESFADAVIRLWTSRELWERVAENGRRNLRKHFSAEAAGKPIDELMEWAGLYSPGRRIGELRAHDVV